MNKEWKIYKMGMQKSYGKWVWAIWLKKGKKIKTFSQKISKSGIEINDFYKQIKIAMDVLRSENE